MSAVPIQYNRPFASGRGDMEQTLLSQGVILMLVGMGTVFVFLSVLVLAMSAMAAVLRRVARAPATDGASAEEVAAIAAAIRRHRHR